MIHAEFFLCLLGFQRLSLRKPKVFSLFTLPMSAPKLHRSPQELSQLDRAGDLYDSIAERLYDAMAGLPGIWMDLGRRKNMMICKDAESTMLSRSYQPILGEKPELYEAYVLCQLDSYTCSILGFVDGCPPQG